MLVSRIWGVDWAAHLVDGLVERQALDLHRPRSCVMTSFAMMPALRRRRVIDGRHYLDQAFLHRDLDPEPAELAARLDLHVPERSSGSM